MTAWKNSPPHLENIMNCHYTKFGTGVAQSSRWQDLVHDDLRRQRGLLAASVTALA